MDAESRKKFRGGLDSIALSEYKVGGVEIPYRRIKVVEDVKITNERLEEIKGLDSSEAFAYWHADQWVGCTQCKRSHHVTSFCQCRSCFFTAKVIEQSDYGTFIRCRKCGVSNLWD